ncbi:MAG TPA: twin-arginine translocase TatA/TatE family subunit [Croceicoccus sp.]|nr:twin-arginine translocase TatA/TatE family subunit [Croceicoccus sp.]
MGSFSLTHWIIVAIVVLVLFGRGKLSETMGDFGKGLREFKKGMNEPDREQPRLPQPEITPEQAVRAEAKTTREG